MTIQLTPDQERLLQESVRNGRFASIDEALNHLFQQLTPEAEPPLEEKPLTSVQEAILRIKERRKGITLPEGMTIRDMIDEGRD